MQKQLLVLVLKVSDYSSVPHCTDKPLCSSEKVSPAVYFDMCYPWRLHVLLDLFSYDSAV